jgi:RHS repeat-associated protein
LAARTYPTGLQVGYNYTARGFVQNVVLKTAAQVNPLPPAQGSTAPATSLTANSVLWTASAIDAWGVAENESFGNGVATATTYDPYTGRMASVSAGTNGNVLNQSYAWDSLSRMTSRADANGAGDNKAVSENFGYGDNVGRLTSYTVSAVAIAGMSRTVNLQYNALGMLLYKSDVGNYVYGAQNTAGMRPHALAKLLGMGSVNYLYDSDGNLASSDGGKYRALTYNSFDLPDSQTGAAGPGGTPSYKWVYDETHARLKETRLDASGTRTTWNLHPDNVGGLGFESETAPSGATSNRHYVSVAGHNVAVLVSTGALPSLGAGQMTPPAPSTCGANCITLVKVEYWHLDHLGSLISTTDHTGAVTQRYAYDPFGKRRGTDGNYDAFGKLVFDWSPTLNSGTDRGFTGHEHLDDIGLIHMNGRIFDPTLGVFLQADPHITDAGNLQSFNRYGYCLNNPLSCTDPSGFDGEPVGPPQTVNVCGNCNAGASDLNDGGSYDGGGYNSSPQWRPGMFKAAVRGAFGRSAQLQMMGLAPLDGAAAVKGFVNWWKATKNYLQHERAVKAAVIMLQGEGFKVLGTEEPALTPGMESYRKYDIVAVNPSGTSIVGIEIKSTEAVTFQLDPQQVAFDVKAVMQGATIFRGDNEGVRITSIMYVGMTMGAQQDANFQSTILRNSLTSANIPTRTMAYSSITQEVGSGK